MPRVTEAHLEARRRQILDAARRRFIANGFHATSMQDILAEAGLSVGAVYRYFPGKEAIVVAIAEEAIATIRASVESEDEALGVREILDRVLVAVDERAESDGLGRLALQVWAEAARSEPLRLRIGAAVADARAALSARIAREHGPEVDADAIAAFIVLQLPGYLQTKVMMGDVGPAEHRRGLEALAALLR